MTHTEIAEGRLLRALYWRALEANVIGATLAFVYLSFVSPPQPTPQHREEFLYLAVAATPSTSPHESRPRRARPATPSC